jgi:hypothetical protein
MQSCVSDNPFQSPCPIITNTIVQNPKSSLRHHRSIHSESQLENAVHNIAANGGASTKDGGIAHFLAEFFPILLEFAGFSAFCWCGGARLADSQRHVAVICRW